MLRNSMYDDTLSDVCQFLAMVVANLCDVLISHHSAFLLAVVVCIDLQRVGML